MQRKNKETINYSIKYIKGKKKKSANFLSQIKVNYGEKGSEIYTITLKGFAVSKTENRQSGNEDERECSNGYRRHFEALIDPLSCNDSFLAMQIACSETAKLGVCRSKLALSCEC